MFYKRAEVAHKDAQTLPDPAPGVARSLLNFQRALMMVFRADPQDHAILIAEPWCSMVSRLGGSGQRCPDPTVVGKPCL